MSAPRFFGFYWTLPVPWAGFSSLPKDVDKAAQASRTIRYQRDVVRRWVKDHGGVLIGEEVFIKLEPDRGSDHITPEIERIAATCRREHAELVLVNFATASGWRTHHMLWYAIEEAGIRPVPIPAEPTFLDDGTYFDPGKHFAAWREIQQAHVTSKPSRKQQLAETIQQLREEAQSLKELAAELNRRGVRTLNGKPWTDENLRKFLAAL